MGKYIKIKKENGKTTEIKIVGDYSRLNGSKDLFSNIPIDVKMFFYDMDGKRAKCFDFEKNTTIERIETEIGNFIIFLDGKHTISFIRTFSTTFDPLDISGIVKGVEIFNKIKVGRKKIKFFGFLNLKNLTKYRTQISIGNDDFIKANIKYVFPNIFRKIYRKTKYKKLFFLNMYITEIKTKDIYEYYLKTSSINIPIFLNIIKNDDNSLLIRHPLKNDIKELSQEDIMTYVSKSCRVYGTDNELYVRKTFSGQYVIVVTNMLSKKIYCKEITGKLLSVLKSTKDRKIYFEKFAQGVDESAFKLFEYAMQQPEFDKNIYIMSKDDKKFKELKNKYPKNIIARNSVMGFYNIFKATHFISSDLASHIQRRLYDNSKWIKRIIYNSEKIFLQHGVALCTNIFARGSFLKNNLYTPNYIVVTSSLEKRMFLENSTYDSDQLSLTGVPNLDDYVAKKDTKKKEITFMLTWRPWDLVGEMLDNSYISRYLQFVDLLKKDAFFSDKKINIILHPRAKLNLEEQFPEKYDIIKRYLYEGTIKEALINSNILVTDYSSIMFYAFAGGTNIVMYWEDKVLAESHYGAPNIMQKEIAFGDTTNSLEETIEVVKKQYDNEQLEEYVKIYANLVDCRFGDNTKNTYEALIKNK